MHQRFSLIIIAFLLSLQFACESNRPTYHSDETEVIQYRLDSSYAEIDSTIYKIIAPYKAQLEGEMNEVIGHLANPVFKNPRIGTMGNFIADIIKVEAEGRFEGIIDFSLMNNGGMRLPDLAAGPLNIMTIYSMLPFNNYLVVVRMGGEDAIELARVIAKGNIDGISGLSIQKDEKGDTLFMVNNVPMDSEREYHIATIDFLLTGGDGYTIFERAIETYKYPDMLRDIVVSHLKQQDEPITVSTKKRIAL